ncbi:sigma-54-dependent Fis family transcriptional regulator [Rhodocytophaga rosea]|uniref:Sigma-54-dependent Fis family transcriptional regulator n=1 Tax=Rhodocytophaga rosea TaxID=2704465 RepID=A0A6C0GGZ4_9BACT|nr:sigma-54 dependent transcriptional regulator [Rhodocytophaga rosea]QHT67033.1 sigma-54-dependent Fis family transcriptional regulator [Rhodocytophaga rosea]
MTLLPGKILIIDDDTDVLLTARMILKRQFSLVHTESDPARIYELLQKDSYDVIVLDMNFTTGQTSGKEGLHWLKEILHLDPGTHVMMNTAYGDIDLAVSAVRQGAIDFLVKPWEKEKLVSSVLTVYQLSQSKKEVRQLRSKQKVLAQDANSHYPELITSSIVMQQVLSSIEKVAITDANVLILGENGTGKELVARAIHRKSGRAEADFIKVDVGAIAPTLFESELFGHVRGAFTDAKEERAGRFEIASGGTLFLDEIGNLPLALQAKLLTVLQNRQISRLGSNKLIPIDIRLVCAANQPLYAMVAENTFRQDLLYRINTVEIKLPPLRERTEDIPVLADHFLNIYTKKYRKYGMTIHKEAIKQFRQYPWPGNIRELQHAIERAVIMSDSVELKSSDFLLHQPAKKAEQKMENYNLEAMEKAAIQQAIKKYKGNLTLAAKELGFGRSTLYRKMEKYGL